MRNAMTIDVEDYYQVSAFSDVIDYNDWDSLESRVEKNTQEIMKIMQKHGQQGTFFILGWVAERHPQLIRDIASEGHEVACHGYSHQLIFNQTPEIFFDETLKAKTILEDIIQQPINGYRAASYSITKNSKWALDILSKLGFTYDSSIFPVYHDRYGIPDAPRHPTVIELSENRSIVEFPLSTSEILGYRFPIAGGGYFRLYPYALTRRLLRGINLEKKPFVFYLHPWEVDSNQPRIEAGFLSKFRHYLNLSRCETRLHSLLNDFQFSTMENILNDLGFSQVSSS